jgi:hypothetical protein
LKFFLHFGEFGIQRLSAHDELVGNDVNLIHRLLKNSVAETTGIRAYCLYTDAAIDKLRLEDISAAMMPHVEAYEHLGEVKTWVQDMHPVWERSRHASRVTIPPEEIMLQVEAEVAMPPNLVWDYLAQPEYRSILLGSDRQQILNRVQGRVAPGSVYHCYHGKRLVRETILEWQPFEGMTTEDLVLPNITALMKATLESMEGRTRLVLTIGKARGPLIIRTFTNLYFGMGEKAVQKDIDRFKERIEADLAERGGPAESQDLSPEAIREAVGEGLGNGGTSPS